MWIAALAGAVLLAFAASPALAQIISERPEKTALTLYQDQDLGLVMVTEWRTVDLPAGESVIRFRGVADGLVPETVAVEGLPARIVEQNQDYSLLSPGSIIEAAVGGPVRRVRTNRQTGEVVEEQAILRSGPKGVVLEIDGRFEALGCSGGPEKLVFDKVPANLADKPTLSILVRAKQAGVHRVRLSYLATGIGWSADYVLSRNPEGGDFTLMGWITLVNETGSSFTDAPTGFIAGRLERSDETVGPVPELVERSPECWPTPLTRRRVRPRPPVTRGAVDGDVEAIVITGSRIRRDDLASAVPVSVVTAEESNIGDYKLYTLPNPTTVAARQTKQVAMLRKQAVTLQPSYRFEVRLWDDWDAESIEPTQILLRTRNTTANGLGRALPAGDIIVTETGKGGVPIIAAETNLWSSAVGSPLEVELEETNAVRAFPRLVRETERGRKTRQTFEVRLENTLPTGVEAEVYLENYGDKLTVDQGPKSVPRSYGRAIPVTLKPGESRTVRFTLQFEARVEA